MLHTYHHRIILLILTSILLYAFAALSISIGPFDLSFLDSLRVLLLNDQTHAAHVNLIIHEVRLPRTLLAIAIGGILALCGTVMQGLFRNPLADPGIIGVSAGASFGAAIAIVLLNGIIESTGLLNFGVVPFFAFIGGTLATLLIYAIGTNRNGTSITTMLLAGVALSAIAGAGIGLLNYIADDEALRDLSLWSMGSLAGATWESITLALICLITLFGVFWHLALPLNALLLGESEARHLGVRVQYLKRMLILFTAIGVGICVSLSGIIGFIGLIVPHIGRIFVGPDHRILLPISTLIGSCLLLLSDMISRTLVSPMEMPVGIITATIGAPFFLFLLYQQRGRFA